MADFIINDQGLLVYPCCGKLPVECTCLRVNIFCPTGQGGGIKPDCKAKAGGKSSICAVTI